VGAFRVAFVHPRYYTARGGAQRSRYTRVVFDHPRVWALAVTLGWWGWWRRVVGS